MVIKCDIFSLKCTRIRLAAGLRPHPQGELKRSPDPLAAIRGKGPREGKGGVGERVERGREGTGKGEEKGREGRGEGRKDWVVDLLHLLGG